MGEGMAARIVKVRRRYDLDLVSRVGLTRRLRGLAVMGWDPTTIAIRAGLAHHIVAQLLCRQPNDAAAPPVMVVERVLAIYDELSMHPGPSDPIREFARDLGWEPPLAWDDDTIDDPAAVPQGIPDQDRASSSFVAHLVDEAIVQCILACFEPEERSRVRTQLCRREPATRHASNAPIAKCGTDSGYYRHLRRLNEPACDRCKAAHAEAEQRRKGTAA